MDKQRMLLKSRKSGLSYQKKGKHRWGSMQMSPILEEELSLSEIIKKVQGVFQEHDENKTGLITRRDMQKLKKEDLPWSTEQLELLFDGLDSDSQGYLTIQEFIAELSMHQFRMLRNRAGCANVEVIVTRWRRKRKDALIKDPANLSLEESDNEQQKCFEDFMSQLGADGIFEELSEVWTIWVQLQQDEPHLLGSLKEFLAKMTHLIKEAKHAKEKLKLILNTRVADHNKEVQQLYVEMEQQIDSEKMRLQRESEIRSKFYSVEMQKALDLREREIQHFLRVQTELETECFSLQEKQHKASTKNQQLKQANIALDNQLKQTLHRLQKAQRHLDAMKNRVSQMFKESGRDRLPGEMSSQTPQISQDENKMVTPELEINFDYRFNKNILDNSAQLAPEDSASATKAESEPRTREIFIEDDPVAEFIEETQPHFLLEPLGQSSLLGELNDAAAALSELPTSQQQKKNDRGFQGEESLDQMRQHGHNQHYITQEKIPQYEAILRNDVLGNRIVETDQDSLQEIHPKGQSYGQGDVLEMEKTSIFEPRLNHKGLAVPMRRESLFSEVSSLGHSKLAAQVSDPKESPEQEDILSLGQVAQPQFHKQALKMRERIHIQWPSVDSGQEMLKKKYIEVEMDKELPSIKGMLLARFPSRTILPKRHLECRPEISLVPNSQLENMSKSETRIQTFKECEFLAEDRKGKPAISEREQDQEAKVEMDKETNVKTEYQDGQVNAETKEISKDTTDVYSYPEHLYNMLFLGDSNVGKTTFLCRLHDNSFRPNIAATIGMDYRIKNLFVDDKCFALRLWDTAGQERYHSVAKQFFRKADGVVLMYDITSENTFADVRYWLSCIQEEAGDGIAVLLLGNKTDCSARRRVSVEDGSRLAQEYGLLFYECSAASGHNVLESMVKFIRLLKAHEDQIKQEILELPALPTKKTGCCS